MIHFRLPLETPSLANQREHWGKRSGRTRAHRQTACLAVRARLNGLSPPCEVTLARISPRQLDDDNLRGALKAVRDGVADALGVDDRDPRVTWRYVQFKGEPRTHEVAITIRPREVPMSDDDDLKALTMRNVLATERIAEALEALVDAVVERLEVVAEVDESDERPS